MAKSKKQKAAEARMAFARAAKASKKTQTSLPRWSNLPVEIHFMILNIVVKDYKYDPKKPYIRAGYATVCREWQPIFEKQNFCNITVNQYRLEPLANMMIHRREYLEHLFLRVRLDEYDCTVCQTKEDKATIRNNNEVFNSALRGLLNILSLWTGLKAEGHPLGRQQDGLTLELGASSPSDCNHSFRDFRLEPDYWHRHTQDFGPTNSGDSPYQLRRGRLGLDHLNDAHHGWVDGHQEHISLEAKKRIMGILTVKPSNLNTYPKVDIVTGLVMRRQFYRKIAVRSLNYILRQVLTSVRWLRHEIWLDVDIEQQRKNVNAYKNLIFNDLPSNIQNISIFEDFNHVLHPDRSTRLASPSLGKALSKSSCSLKILSASFIVDAVHFFADFSIIGQTMPNTTMWVNLERLALTSRLLNKTTSRWRVNGLMVSAGRAASRMPKLQIMEIWNGESRRASIFRYKYNSGKPQISWHANFWRDTLQFKFPPEVIHWWTILPQHTELIGDISTESGLLQGSTTFVPHVHPIECLEQRKRVVSRISRDQMWNESREAYGKDIKKVVES